MKFLFDLAPVILFFIAYKLSDIYVATGVAMVASVVQIAWLWLRRQPIDPMLWASLAIVVVFGGATLTFQDETFIKWKPTILYWLFASVVLGGPLLAKKNPIRAMLGRQVSLPDRVWSKLNTSWGVFFAAMGAINLWVAFNFSTDTWVNFKLFGATGLMLVFVVGQAFFLARHMTEDAGEP